MFEANRKKYGHRSIYRAAAMLALAAVLFLAGCSADRRPITLPAPSADGGAATQTPAPAPTPEDEEPVAVDEDLVIPVSDVSQTAMFYPVEIDGTRLEVIAVMASDDTIRTAFNTCQVCYDSGRGYYKQSGDSLVCQNCGNRFKMDQVEVMSGGCNPVPIFAENKSVDDESITVPYEFLSEAKVIFSNWKAAY
ncbi:MAG: DUF2318 domain-containing protein [Christensenellales bacterium]|jgi:uncharacterized membrane protein